MTAAPTAETGPRTGHRVSIRRRLVIGSGALVGLMFVAGIVAHHGMTQVAEEQSAACEQMTSSSTHLLESSTRLKELVGGLKTAV